MNHRKITIYALVLGGYVIFSFIAYFVFTSRLRSLVKVDDIELVELYNIGSSQSPDFRAKIEVALSNYGNIATTATVRVFVRWANDNSSQTTKVQTTPHSTTSFLAELRATNGTFEYGGEIVECNP